MQRLVRSHLVERAPAERLVAVVRDVCGIHAQVMGSAELQLAARVEEITQADVREALWERRVLAKTWTLRGTLHIHPADELGLWTAARRALVREEADRRVVAAIGKALRGRQLTREELADAVTERVGSAPREQLVSGWGYFLADAAIVDELCFGPPQGQKVTFVHPDDWLGPRRRSWEPAAALHEVARRYASTYGPVTHRQFREWVASRDPALADLDLPEPDEAPAQGSSVRLLPEYDVYVMGVRERDQLVPPAVREQVAAHGRGRYEGAAGVSFLLVEGVAAGLWRRKKGARHIDLHVEPARRLTKAVRAGVQAEAERIGAFYGLEPRLTVSRAA